MKSNRHGFAAVAVTVGGSVVCGNRFWADSGEDVALPMRDLDGVEQGIRFQLPVAI